MRFSWLHLSDLHFGVSEKDITDQELLREKLLDDVTDQIRNEHMQPPSLLFITGDVIMGAKGGTPKEDRKAAQMQFKNTAGWIRDTAKRLKIKPANVFITPGNHDVVWSAQSTRLLSLSDLLANTTLPGAPDFRSGRFRKCYTEEITDFNANPDSSEVTAEYMAGLATYMSFVRSFSFARHQGSSHGQFYRDSSFWARRSINDELDVEVFGLNTSWACSEEVNHLPALPTGISEQVDRLTSAAKHERNGSDVEVLRIALMHHPVGWVLPYERPDFQRKMHSNFDVLLRGHEHSEWINQFGASMVEISAPAAFQQDREQTRGYSLVEFDSQTRKCRVNIREYSFGDDEYKRSTSGGWPGNSTAAATPVSTVVQLCRPGVDVTPGSTGLSHVRRIGFTSSTLQPVGSGSHHGAILVFDILRFSAMSIDHQRDSIRTLWDRVSSVCQEYHSIQLAAFMPVADGMIVAIDGNDSLQACRCAAYVAKKTIKYMIDRGSLPRNVYLRAGISYGEYATLTQYLSESVVVAGTAVNAARKAAYMTDPNTVVFAGDVYELLSMKSSDFSAEFRLHGSRSRLLTLSTTQKPSTSSIVELKPTRAISAYRKRRAECEARVSCWLKEAGARVSRTVTSNGGRAKVVVSLGAMRQTVDGYKIDNIHQLSGVALVDDIAMDGRRHILRSIARFSRPVFINLKQKICTIDKSDKSTEVGIAQSILMRDSESVTRHLTIAAPAIAGAFDEHSLCIPVLLVGTSTKGVNRSIVSEVMSKIADYEFPLDGWAGLHVIHM